MTKTPDDNIFFKQLEWELDLDSNTIYLSNDITTFELLTFMEKVNMLLKRSNNSDINLVIASNGGNADAMLGIIDYIRSLPVKVNTKCIGGAYSAAAVILACGTGTRTITKNSTVMLHEGSSFGSGKTSDMITGADHLKTLTSAVNDLLASVTKRDKKFWIENLKTDMYLTSKEALSLGIVDKIE